MKFEFSHPAQAPIDTLKEGDVFEVPILRGQRFRVISIKRGGMGIVARLGYDRPGEALPKSDSWLALKTYRLSFGPEQFDREAEAWFKVSALPGVLPPLGYTIVGSHGAIVMPWIDYSLSDVSARELGVDRALAVLGTIAQSFHGAIERHNILHRDIKPGNILLKAKQEPFIIDFGISQMHQQSSTAPLAGTPAYMAPELLNHSSRESLATEVFSFGITALEWLLGEHPYKRVEFSDFGIRQLAQTMERPLIRELGPTRELSPALRTILACVEYSPAQRPKSFGEISEILGTHRSVPSAGTESESALPIFLAAQKDRVEGKHSVALRRLDEGLQHRPNDPLLLNGKGNTLIAMGKIDEAALVFQNAYEGLMSHQGKYNGKTYIDPALALFRFMLERGDIQRAHEIGANCRRWIGDNKKLIFLYDSLAWEYVFEGDFSTAIDILASHLERNILEPSAAEWMVFALLAVDQMDDGLLLVPLRTFAPRILSVFLGEFTFRSSTPFVLKILVAYSPEPQRSRGVKILEQLGPNFPEDERELLAKFMATGIPTKQDVALLFLMLDQCWFGGKWQERMTTN